MNRNTFNKLVLAGSATVLGLSVMSFAAAPSRSLVKFATDATVSSVSPLLVSVGRLPEVVEDPVVVEPVAPTSGGDITITPTPTTGDPSPRLPPVRPPFRPTIRSPFTP